MAFPKPYKNEVPKAEDPMMVSVPKEKMGIGARSSGLPKGSVNSSGMNLSHVGGSEGTKG